MNNDDTAALLNYARAVRIEDVQAEFDAAVEDPILQDVVESLVEPYRASLTSEQIEHSRKLLLAFFATDPRAERLLDRIRSAGGRSHVVATTPTTPVSGLVGVQGRRGRQ